MKRMAVPLSVVVLVAICFVGAVGADDRPMADAGLDQEVSVNTTVHLDATGSTHDSGEIDAYEWRIETPDGEQLSPECSNCARTVFTPTDPGRYDVELTAVSDDGETSTDVMFVYVDDAGPSVELSGETSPRPGEENDYVADVEATGGELEEIGWAVEDELVVTEPLDGRSDEAELSLSFPGESTYRLQVVVVDEDGRTAYDELLVRPSDDEPGTTDWDDVDTSVPDPDCSDPDYMADNLDECVGIEPETPTETPTTTQTPEPEMGQPHDILFNSDGYGSNALAGAMEADSSYLGTIADETGLDGGANDPTEQSTVDQLYDDTIGELSRTLFGQDRETVSCEAIVGEVDGCHATVQELEDEGTTTNVDSPTVGGAYSTYGIQDAERTAGLDPTDPDNFNEGDTLNVTIVVQEEEDGLVHEAVDAAGNATDAASDRVQDLIGGDDSEDEADESTPEPDTTESDTTEPDDSNTPSSSTGTNTRSGSNSGLTDGSDNDPFSNISVGSDDGSADDDPSMVRGGLTR